MTTVRCDSSVSALQSETGMTNGEVALIAGYSTPGDGGGGMLFFTTSVPSSRTITNATNATPIVITTSNAHGLVAGQRVMVAGVQGNTAANGTWIVGSTTSTTFQLLRFDGTSTTGNGAWTAGGIIGDNGRIPSGSVTQGFWTRM